MNRINETIKEKLIETIDETIKNQLDELSENLDFVTCVEMVFNENLGINEYLNTQIKTMVTPSIQTNLEEKVKEQIQLLSRDHFRAVNKRIMDHREIFKEQC